VPVKRVKEFEAHFLLEMENKLPEVLAEFKKGQLVDASVAKMVALSNELIVQYKK